MAQQEDKVTDTQSAPLPALEFIYFLKVKVTSAKDLEEADFMGKSDPFCKVIANKQSWKTKTIPKTVNPKWDEETEFVFFDRLKTITFEVFDADQSSKSDTLGSVTLNTADFYNDNAPGFSGWLKLENCDKGSIEVCVTGRLIKPLEMEQKCEELDTECKKQEGEINKKKIEITALVERNGEMAENKAQLQKKIETLKTQYTKIETDIATCHTQNEKKAVRCEELKQKRKRYKEKIANYTRDNTVKQTQYENEESKFDQQNNAHKVLQNQYQTKKDGIEDY